MANQAQRVILALIAFRSRVPWTQPKPSLPKWRELLSVAGSSKPSPEGEPRPFAVSYTQTSRKPDVMNTFWSCLVLGMRTPFEISFISDSFDPVIDSAAITIDRGFELAFIMTACVWEDPAEIYTKFEAATKSCYKISFINTTLHNGGKGKGAEKKERKVVRKLCQTFLSGDSIKNAARMWSRQRQKFFFKLYITQAWIV